MNTERQHCKGMSNRRGRSTQLIAGRNNYASLDDWYLDLVKKRRQVSSLHYDVNNSSQSSDDEALEITPNGSTPPIVNTQVPHVATVAYKRRLTAHRHSSAHARSASFSTPRIMKNVATDPRILTKQKNAMTLSHWYDYDDDVSVTDDPVAGQTSSVVPSTSHESNESTSRLSTPAHSGIEIFSGQQAADIMAQEIAMRVKLREKIRRTSELLEMEKNSQQDSVNEYLRISGSISSADRAQAQRVKSAFERRNQKLTDAVRQLHKKLDSYHMKLEELNKSSVITGNFSLSGSDTNPSPGLDLLRGLRNVSTNVRSGISEFSGTIVAKPKVFAHMIRNRFGSADNITTMNDSQSAASLISVGLPLPLSLRYHSDEDVSKLLPVHSSSTEDQNLAEFYRNYAEAKTTVSRSGESRVLTDATGVAFARSTLRENQYLLDEQEAALFELETQITEERLKWKTGVGMQKKRIELLEEKLNDMTEYHQCEVTSIKQTLSVFEEKLSYQLDERIRDMQDMVDNCQTRLAKLKTTQQPGSVDGLENSQVRRNVVKLVNIGLSVIAVLLIIVNIIIDFSSHFFDSRSRCLVSAVCIVMATMLWFNWD